MIKGLYVRDCNSFTKFKTRQKSRENEQPPQILKLQSQQNVKKLPPKGQVISQNQFPECYQRPKTKSVMQSNQSVCQKPSKKILYDAHNYITSKYYPNKQLKQQTLIKNRSKKTHSVSYYQSNSLHQDLEDHQQNHISNVSFKDQLLVESDSQSKPHLLGKLNKLMQDKSNEVLEGKRLFSEGQTEEAQKAFEEILQTSNNAEARYLIGVCFLSQGKYEEAIQHLTHLVLQQPLHKRNAYVLLAIAYKKSNKINESLQILSQAVRQFTKYFDAYIYRGKIYLKLKQYEKALKDFTNAMDIQPTKAIGYIGQAECFKALNQLQSAIDSLTAAINTNDQMKRQALIKRTLLFIEMKEYDLSLIDIDKLLEIDETDSEALYFRGFVQSKKLFIQEALLSFEQSIKHNNSKKAVTKSLYEIARLKIDQRDFYEAFYQLSRADYLDVDQKMLEKFKLFTDGVIFLMKRKYDEGVESLTSLIQKNQVSDFLKPLIYQYRAFGYFCQSQYAKALLDLNQISQLEKPSIYNKYICEGIISAMQNMFEQSQGYFLKAQKLLPNKMEPYFYKATTLIRFYTYLIPRDDQEKRQKFLNDALKYMNKAVELNEQSNLLFYRGILLFAQGEIDLALVDMEKAIEKSEDNIAKHFFVRGLIQASRKAFKASLSDLTITINLDEKLIDAYLARSKIFLILGDRNSAYYDVMKYLELKPNEAQQYIMAGNMLFHIQAYEDAIKTYSNVTNTDKNIQVLYLRAKTFIIIKELNNALVDLQKIVEQTNETHAIIDFNVLQTLKMTSSSSDDETFTEAFNCLNQLLKRNQDGKIFLKSDILFYRGIYQFYLKQYEQAQQSIRQSYDLKEENQNKLLSNRLNDSDQFILESLNTSNTKLDQKIKLLEEFEFQDRTYNLFEYLYNSAVIDLILGKNKQAIDSFQLLLENIKGEALQQKLQSIIDLLKSDQSDGPIDENLSKINNLVIFPQLNRLCSIYQIVEIPLKKYPQKMQAKLSFCLPTIEIPALNNGFDEKLMESINPTVVENKPEAPWIKRTLEGVIFTDNVQTIEDLDLKSTTRQEADIQQVQISQEDEQIDFQKFEDQFNHDEKKQCDYSIIEQSQLDDILENQQEQKIDLKTLKQELMLDSKIADKLEQILKKKQKKQ